jgi:hypothetical protein
VSQGIRQQATGISNEYLKPETCSLKPPAQSSSLARTAVEGAVS